MRQQEPQPAVCSKGGEAGLWEVISGKGPWWDQTADFAPRPAAQASAVHQNSARGWVLCIHCAMPKPLTACGC